MNIFAVRRSIFALALIGALAYPEGAALTDKEALRKAHRGDTASMRIIGKRKFFGSAANGTRVDRTNGFAWLEKAAGRGDVEAKYLIGLIYCKGEYVSKNMQKGVQFLTDAAGSGDEKAKKALLQLPLEHSAPWVKEKATRGDMSSALRLTKAYLLGEEGLSVNNKEALKYFMMYYKSEPSKALKKLNSWPLNKALPIWKSLAENEHDVDAALMLGKVYDKGGSGVSSHSVSARKYYSLAAAAGNKEAVAWMQSNQTDYVSDEERRRLQVQAAAREEAWKHVQLQEPEERLAWLEQTLKEVPSSDGEWNKWSDEFKKTKKIVEERAIELENARARTREWNTVVKLKDLNTRHTWLENALKLAKPDTSEWNKWSHEISLVKEQIRQQDEADERLRQWDSRKNSSPDERVIWLTDTIANQSLSMEERNRWKDELSRLQEEMKSKPAPPVKQSTKLVERVVEKERSLWERLLDHLWEAILSLIISSVGGAIFLRKHKSKK